MSEVLVPVSRMRRWLTNFEGSHGQTELQASSAGALAGTGQDGSTFEAHLPFDRTYDGPVEVEAFLAAATPPKQWGVLLIRKGGFAIARLEGITIIESKVGRRHVQGRTKAGGQSQQRFARRRENQARVAYEAATDHAVRILRPGVLVTGGDHMAVDAVLEDPRLAGMTVVAPWLAVPDPRRDVLESAASDACSVRIAVVNR